MTNKKKPAGKSVIRTGRVSSIDYKRGTCEVTYSDRGESVTASLPSLSNGEYRMPNVGDVVLVNHLSNGTSAGVVVGTIWNDTNKPPEGYKGLYRKEFGTEPGQAFERYDAGTGEYVLASDKKIKITANEAVISISESGAVEITSPVSIRIAAPTVDIVEG